MDGDHAPPPSLHLERKPSATSSPRYQGAAAGHAATAGIKVLSPDGNTNGKSAGGLFSAFGRLLQPSPSHTQQQLQKREISRLEAGDGGVSEAFPLTSFYVCLSNCASISLDPSST